MAQARRSTTRSKSTGARSTSRSKTPTPGPRALDRLDKSIDAAEGALKDLRSELGRGGRDLVKDLDRTLRDSRKNLRSLSRTVAKLQRAATTGKTTAPGGRRAGARKTTTRSTRSSSAKK
jgi:ABC-type transporter Mla subunit MlaD